MYMLESPIARVKGVGPHLLEAFTKHGVQSIKDLLLHVPLRYEDRSQHVQVKDLKVGELTTLTGQIVQARNFYKGRRSIQSANLVDESGKVKLMWFNNPHVIDRFKVAATFFVSGKLSERGIIVHPTVEVFKEDTIHTGRLVPVYSNIPDVPAGTLRKVLKEVVDHLSVPEDSLADYLKKENIFPLQKSLQQLHFPEDATSITQSRERLAIEELVQLILRSQSLKEQWRQTKGAVSFPAPNAPLGDDLPFKLTKAQNRSLMEVIEDLQAESPMNRLLLGDVGSGKTAVAGLASQHVLTHGHHVCFVTPTQILAEQHYNSLQKLFPELKITLVTSQNSRKIDVEQNIPTLFIGTHALFSKLETISPALLIYDEQHRFGVKQRSLAQQLTRQPHLLTLTATPIPRTLLLTIFSHLSMSIIDELPPGRKPVKTWLVSSKKRTDGYKWVAEQISNSEQPSQALIVCPFIDPSRVQAFENIAAANELYEELKKLFSSFKKKNRKPITTALLHGRMSKKDQQQISEQLFAQQIDVLVTTPIIEVGLDLPAADMIVIEAAERFGLASLHQLRGRVGRTGQQAYCLLLTNSTSEEVKDRLTQFSQTHDGIKLAEQDLQRRGAGDIFGTQQHGLDQLIFANWTNLNLITHAKQVADQLLKEKSSWQSPFHSLFSVLEQGENIPLAN